MWLSTEPPIFQINDWDTCRPCPVPVIYERCAPSKRFEGVAFGPASLIAFTAHDPARTDKSPTSNIVLFQDGHEIGRLEHVLAFDFVPAP